MKRISQTKQATFRHQNRKPNSISCRLGPRRNCRADTNKKTISLLSISIKSMILLVSVECKMIQRMNKIMSLRSRDLVTNLRNWVQIILIGSFLKKVAAFFLKSPINQFRSTKTMTECSSKIRSSLKR